MVALTHATGCGMDMGEGMDMLRRTLAGYARHANFAASLFIGLGCEANQMTRCFTPRPEGSERLARYNIQDAGGTAKAVERVSRS